MAPAIASPKANTVCVMDASSTLGAALVDRLLHRGYNIHASTVARIKEATKASWSDKKRVKMFRSDPLDYQSMEEFMVEVEVEVRAVHNVLEACAQAEAVEKVVFTSSVTAAIWMEKRNPAEDVDERDWSEPNFCRKFKVC